MLFDKYVVGITGGIASGKSAFSASLVECGACVLDADKVSREIVSQPLVLDEIKNNIEGVVCDRVLDRGLLRKKIFEEVQTRQTLDNIMHPKIIAQIKQQIKQSKMNIIFVDAALLVETKMYAWMDSVVLITAPEPIKIQRIVTRDGVTPESAKRTIESQLGDREKLPYAKWVVSNEGDLQMLKDKARKIFGQVQEHWMDTRQV